MKHDIHMRLQIEGGKTNYEGVYAVSKYSTLSVSKSKVSPLMGGFNIIIDITKGGVIDRPGSFIWWMANLTSPSIFNQAAWWSISDWCYEKYKPYWDKFTDLVPKFRQSKLYELGNTDENLIKLLQLIWLDLLSDKYVLQREVIKSLRDKVEAELIQGLGLTYDEVHPPVEESKQVNLTDEEVSQLSEILGSASINTDTGEVLE